MGVHIRRKSTIYCTTAAISNTKELIVDFRKKAANTHSCLHQRSR